MSLNSELRTVYLPTSKYRLFIKYVVGNNIDLGNYIPVVDGIVIHKNDAPKMRDIVEDFLNTPLGKV